MQVAITVVREERFYKNVILIFGLMIPFECLTDFNLYKFENIKTAKLTV